MTGQHGQVAQALQKRQCLTSHEIICVPKSQMDITQPSQIERTFSAIQPRLVINAAAYTAVDQAEQDAAQAIAVNRDGAANLARCCVQSSIPLLHLSTDYVFDGTANSPYRETQPPAPLNLYAQSKWQGEQSVRRICPQHIILRTSGVFGCHGQNFVKTIATLARTKTQLQVVCDQIVCPTPSTDLAQACLDIAQAIFAQHVSENVPTQWQWGTYHYCSSKQTSWYDFANAIVETLRELEPLPLCITQVCAIQTDEFATLAKRPKYTALCCDKIEVAFGIRNRSWRTGLIETLKKLCNEP